MTSVYIFIHNISRRPLLAHLASVLSQFHTLNKHPPPAKTSSVHCNGRFGQSANINKTGKLNIDAKLRLLLAIKSIRWSHCPCCPAVLRNVQCSGASFSPPNPRPRCRAYLRAGADVRRSAQLRRDTTNSVRVSRLQLVTGHADLNISTPQHPVQFRNLDSDTFVPMPCGDDKCLSV